MNRASKLCAAVSVTVLLALSGCTHHHPASTQPQSPQARCPEVRVFGSIPQMKGGDLSTQVELAELEWNDATVALGATTGKKMEITAVDAQLELVGPSGSGAASVRHPDPSSEGAAFLVYASPSRWFDAGTVEATDIATVLRAVGTSRERSVCAASEVVPFRARGHASTITWSTVGQPSGHEQTDRNVDVVLVGFWSPSSQGVFVPPGLDGHVHVYVPSIERGGHLRAIHFEGHVQLELAEATG